MISQLWGGGGTQGSLATPSGQLPGLLRCHGRKPRCLSQKSHTDKKRKRRNFHQGNRLCVQLPSRISSTAVCKQPPPLPLQGSPGHPDPAPSSCQGGLPPPSPDSAPPPFLSSSPAPAQIPTSPPPGLSSGSDLGGFAGVQAPLGVLRDLMPVGKGQGLLRCLQAAALALRGRSVVPSQEDGQGLAWGTPLALFGSCWL